MSLDAREILQDHGASPRGQAPLAHPTHRGEGFNPLCGDRVTYTLRLQDDCIAGVHLSQTACTICAASASMLAERAEGAPAESMRRLISEFRAFLSDRNAKAGPELGDLEALAGVRAYPVRVRCALLPWATFEQALEQPLDAPSSEPARTEDSSD